MHEVDRVLSRVPVLVNDFLRHVHSRGALKVFLCGSKPEDLRFDLRVQVKRVLNERWGCRAFLGEEIDPRRVAPRVDADILSIEVHEAASSDLVVMFLGSPGTIAEVTAFALDAGINKKLVVFNDAIRQHERSFLNRGPLRLIDRERLIYYDARSDMPSPRLLVQLDKVIAAAWFRKHDLQTAFAVPLQFPSFAALALIYALYPVRYRELRALYPFDEDLLRSVLRELFDRHLVQQHERKYVPGNGLEEAAIAGGLAADIGRVRVGLMANRLRNPEVVSDYRLAL